MQNAIKIFVAILIMVSKVTAQNPVVELPKRFTNTVYDVKFLKISADNRWLSFQKSYEYNTDTLVLIDRNKPNVVYAQKPGAIPLYTSFTPRGYLFLRSQNSAELLKLPTSNSVTWGNIKNAVYDTKYNVFLIINNDGLQIFDEAGELINKIPNTKVLLNYGEERFAVATQEGKEHLYKIEGKNVNPVYTSSEKIKFILLYASDGKAVVMEEGLDGKNRKIKYIGARIPRVLKIGKGIDENIKSAEVKSLANDCFFVKLSVNQKRRDYNAADIWYANDNNFTTKFWEDVVEYTFIWDFVNNTTKLLSNTDEEKIFYLGHPNYLLRFYPFKGIDYTSNSVPYAMDLIRDDKKATGVVIKSSVLIGGKDKNYLLAVENNYWKIYNLNNLSSKRLLVEYRRYDRSNFPKAHFSENGEKILFESKGCLYEYAIKSEKLKCIQLLNEYETEIVNTKRSPFVNFGAFNHLNSSVNSYNSSMPVLIRLYNRENNKTALATYDGKRVSIVVNPTENNISTPLLAYNTKAIVYSSNTMSEVPKILYNDGLEKETFVTNTHDTATLSGLRSTIVKYAGPDGQQLQGILIFPLHYHEGKKSPMVVSIYERRGYLSNKYLKDGFYGPSEGLNIRNFIQKGYFVFLPDIVFGSKGTGESALVCVHNSLDALKDIKDIDFKSVGLIGFSHGGYQTNYIATRSDRFAAYIAGAGNSDLVRSYFSYNYNFSGPFYWQFENGQYEMPKPFFDDKELYTKNSPVYNADKVQAPILLWTGDKDQNVNWEQTMEYFLSLKRSGKKSVAVFYPNESHGVYKIPNLLDLHVKVENWFDYFLKGEGDIPWIDKQMNKTE